MNECILVIILAVITSGYDVARSSITPSMVLSFYTELGFAHHTWNDLKIQFWSKASVSNGRAGMLGLYLNYSYLIILHEKIFHFDSDILPSHC